MTIGLIRIHYDFKLLLGIPLLHFSFFFFLNDTAPPEIYPLPLHDALPIPTAILSFNQAILAAKAGATYVSIFSGRVADEGNDPTVIIRNVRQWLDAWDYTAKIIVGSVRTVMDVQAAALAGAHIITIPPPFLAKMVDHKYTRETVRQFNQDADKAMAQIAEVHAKSTTAGR